MFFADDLDRVLVRADRAVGAKAVEQRAHDVVRLRSKIRIEGEAAVRDIVLDADGEMVLWRGLRQFVEHRFDHRRREFLRGQAVASADDGGSRARSPSSSLRAAPSTNPDRAARRAARFLRAIQHRDVRTVVGQRFDEAFDIERTVQPHLEHADLFACAFRASTVS